MRLLKTVGLLTIVHILVGCIDQPVYSRLYPCDRHDDTAETKMKGKQLFRGTTQAPAHFHQDYDLFHPGPLAGQRPPIVVAPNFVLGLDGGFLVSINKGEWGGKLVYQSSNERYDIFRGNPLNIYPSRNCFIVLEGLSHLDISSGSIRCIRKDATGRFSSTRLHGLPATPEDSWLQEDGDILIQLRDGRTMVLEPSSALRHVSCSI